MSGPGRDVLLIAASARRDGNTGRLAAHLMDALGARATLLDLNDLFIGAFRYGVPEQDDFARVAAAMATHRHIVFATPVYWYAMSGRLKTLFDRLTDLLGQPEGRALAGRQMWLAAIGTDPALPEGFAVPFAQTAAYFGIDWRGAAYVVAPGEGLVEAGALAPLDALLEGLKG